MLLARIAALLLPAFALAAETNDEEFRQLTADTFKPSVANGAWLVEHFSPRCPHCRSFEPTWKRLAQDLKHLETVAGFHMAQVNCLAQGDNNIKGYPQLELYVDGKRIKEYNDDRNYDFLSKWINDEAVAYARTIVLGSGEDTTTESEPYRHPNPEGKVVEVDAKELQKFKDEGPVFIKFYAPWCTHCKHLAPIYDQLANEVRGQINVVAVNCDKHASLCRDNGIEGYPTLKLSTPFAGGYKDKSYQKGRSVEAMKAFLEPSLIQPKMHPMKLEDLDHIVRDEDAFILYLQSYATSLTDLTLVETSTKPFLGKVPVFTSNDPLLFKNLSIANPPPTSVLLAFAGHSAKPVATLAFPTDDQEAVTNFMNRNRYPLIETVTFDTYNDMMSKDDAALVVLAAMRSDVAGKEDLAEFEKMARAFRHGARSQYKPVRFVVSDSILRPKMKLWFDMKADDLPRFVVVDPVQKVYYKGTVEGKEVAFNGEDAFSVVEAVWQGWARPIPIRTSLRSFTGSSFTKVLALVVLGFVAHRLVRWYRHRRELGPTLPGGYLNEKGLGSKPARLD